MASHSLFLSLIKLKHHEVQKFRPVKFGRIFIITSSVDTALWQLPSEIEIRPGGIGS